MKKAKLQKRTFPVLGMSCAGCSARVERTLKAQEGVEEAAVNLAAATATVTFDTGICPPEELRDVLRKIGFDLIIVADENVAAEEAEEAHTAEYRALKRRTLWAVTLAVPVAAIGMFLMHEAWSGYALWILSTPVVFGLGRGFFAKAWKLLQHGSANMDTLVATSTGISYIYSLFALFFPSFWIERGLTPHVYFETSAMIIAFILFGRLLEARAKGSTSAAIRRLMGLQPKTVIRIEADGRQQEVEIAHILPGNNLLARPGERIAVDGKVIDGHSFIDESLMSGEPIPVEKQSGDSVFAGTINQRGTLTYRAEKVGSETVLAQIIRMVQEAQGSKAPVQRLVDRVAAVFVPTIMGLALLTFLCWCLFSPTDGLTLGLHTGVTVLVIACPCALGLATPTAIMVGIGKGAEAGILIRNAETLETARHIDTVVLDKTGTITEGHPTVTDFYPTRPIGKRCDAVSSLERLSEHPLAEAVVTVLDGKTVPVVDFTALPGLGISGTINGEAYYIGNRSLLESQHVHISEALNETAAKLSAEGKSLVWMAAGQEAFCLCAIADEIKPTSTEAIAALRKQGIDVWMLTGDNAATALATARAVGLQHIEAGIRPDGKADFVKRLQAQGRRVCMVGDGINDSAALAQADLSIAMGRGSDTAMNVAGMTIIASDLRLIATAIRLSRLTVRTIRENLFWAFIYNLIGIPLAAGVLYPVCGFLLSPMIAGATMAMSSVSVVLNSLRLKRRRIS